MTLKSTVKTLRHFFFFPIEDQELDLHVQERLNSINLSHIRVLNIFILLFSSLQLISDLFTRGNWSSEQLKGFLVLDSLLLVFSLLCLLCLLQNRLRKHTRWMHFFQILFCSVILFWGAAVSSIEYSNMTGNLTFILVAALTTMLIYHSFHEIFLMLLFSMIFRVVIGPRLPGGEEVSVELIQILIVSLIVLLVGARIIYTNRKRSFYFEYRMLKALREKRKASREKTDFLQNISHELRTPLTGILGFADALSQSAENPASLRFSQLITSEGEKLLSLINRLLDISKIEAGKLELHHEVFPFRQCIQDFAEAYKERAHLKGLDFYYSMDNSLPEFLIGDEERLMQVFGNLVGNALKFTSMGYVSLEINSVTISEKSASMKIEITDTGMGIDKEQQLRIFNPFEQADKNISKTFGGTGLGTTISKQLVELMGGTIDVISQPGEGTSFIIHLTLEISKESLSAGTHRPIEGGLNLEGKRILVVEDYEINRKIASMFLEKEGALVSLAGNGRECLDTLSRERFDIILLDVQMPVMDGLETIKNIRGDENLKNYLVLGLTADAYEEDRKRFIAHGMNEVISKPFSRSSLVRKINEQLALKNI